MQAHRLIQYFNIQRNIQRRLRRRRLRLWARRPIRLKVGDLRIKTLVPDAVSRVAEALYDPEGKNKWNVNSKEDCEKLLHKIIELHQQRTLHPFYWTLNNHVVGISRFKRIDAHHLTLEISGIWISYRWRNLHISSKVKLAMLSYCFEILQCERVEFRVREDSLSAQRELMNLGAVLEGVMRGRLMEPDGSAIGCMIYSFIKEDWPKTKENGFNFLSKYKNRC